MIHVVAIITAKPGMREAILKEFRANVPAVHAEDGCIEYGPAGPYSMQPSSAWTAGTLARNSLRIASRMPGLAVMMATTWIMDRCSRVVWRYPTPDRCVRQAPA